MKFSLHSAEESQVAKYLKQQEELRKKFKSRNITTASIRNSKKTKAILKVRKRHRQIPLGTETVDDCNLRSDGPLLSERVTVDFNESSGSEYIPSADESDASDEGVFYVTIKMFVPTEN